MTEDLLESVLAHAHAAGGGRVTGVHVLLGRDGHLSADSLRFYWPLVSDGTPAARARLHVRGVAGDALRLRAIDLEPEGSPGSPELAGGAHNNGSIGTGTPRGADTISPQ